MQKVIFNTVNQIDYLNKTLCVEELDASDKIPFNQIKLINQNSLVEHSENIFDAQSKHSVTNKVVAHNAGLANKTFMVDKILSHVVNEKNEILYETKWKTKEISFEPASSFLNGMAIKEYWDSEKKKSKQK